MTEDKSDPDVKPLEPPPNSLAARYSEVAAQWHPTKNGELRAEGRNQDRIK